MAGRGERLRANDLDGLRIFGLGRIPRCADCPRYDRLRQVYGARSGARPRIRGPLPAVPSHCPYQYCSPLARRYETVAQPSAPPVRPDVPQALIA